jgi:hypothetical protein
MLFENTTTGTEHPHTVTKKFGKVTYVCEPGKTVEIPDIFAAAVERERSNLKPCEGEVERAARRQVQQKREATRSAGPPRPPCLEEWLDAGYPKEKYEEHFAGPEWGPTWSNPNYKSQRATKGDDDEDAELERATRPDPAKSAPKSDAPPAPTGDIDPDFAPPKPAQPKKK